MANCNRVFLIGRLTRDAEVRTFTNGGKVAHLGFAVTGERRKDPQTGQWEDVPCFIDVKVFNRGDNGRQADMVGELKKGMPLFVEGHLVLETWDDKNGGGKRSKHVVVADNFQFLAPKEGGGQQPQRGRQPAAAGDERPADEGNIPF